MTTHPHRHDLEELVRTAHADAWQEEGRLREPHGGGVCAVQGARAMASGIRTPKWNNADVTHDQVDIKTLSAWYAARDMPWGLRVPLELSLAVGEPLFVKRCMGRLASSRAESGQRLVDPPSGVRSAGSAPTSGTGSWHWRWQPSATIQRRPGPGWRPSSA